MSLWDRCDECFNRLQLQAQDAIKANPQGRTYEFSGRRIVRSDGTTYWEQRQI